MLPAKSLQLERDNPEVSVQNMGAHMVGVGDVHWPVFMALALLF